MLDGRGNHAHSMGSAAKFSSRCQCLIVGFGTARSKNDLARRATEAFCNRCASIHHGMQRRTPRRVHAPRIAEVDTEIRKHSLKHAYVQSSCCGVIEIYHSYFSKPYIIKVLGIIFYIGISLILKVNLFLVSFRYLHPKYMRTSFKYHRHIPLSATTLRREPS